MVEIVVIGKDVGIATGVIRWVDVNQFNLAGELLFQRMQCQQIVAFYKQVIGDGIFG